MTITVSSGVTSTLTVTAGDPVVVLSGGTLLDSTILSGGSATLDFGGVASDLLVSSGGVLTGQGELVGGDSVFGFVSGVAVSGIVELFGSARDVTLLKSSVLDGGGTATGTIVSDGAELENGVAIDSQVENGGEERLFPGAVGSGDTIGRGGLLQVVPGGTAIDETVQSGGTFQFNGDVASDLTLGAATSTTVLDGVTVSSGGYIELGDATVRGGVTLSLRGTTTAADDVNVDSGGVLLGAGDVYSGVVAGSIDDVTVGGGGDIGVGRIDLVSGGSAVDVTLAVPAGPINTELEIDGGASATGTVVNPGGKVVVEGGGDAAGTTVLTFASVYLLGGGTTGTVLSGVLAQEIVSAGAHANDTAISNDGRAIIASGGSAVSATVSSGGNEYVLSSGTATGTVIGDGGLEYIQSGGAASGDIVQSGGLLVLQAGGIASDVTVQSSGRLDFEGNVTASITVGRVTSTTVLGGVTVESGGGIELVGATVVSGGTDAILHGGVADGATVLSGGKELISSGGTALGTVVSSGGGETISSGGLVIAPTVLAGGAVLDEGEVRFDGAGTLAGMLSGSGAVIQTEAGDLVMSDSGAGFSGVAAIRGGTIELATSGALGTGYVEFAEPSTGSAVLQIDAADAPAAGGTFANTISNFSGANEDIDLRSIAFVAGATATVVGSTLVLNDGGATYTFKLAGGTAGAYPVLSDGQGGTLIDPTVARFAQTAAAFAPSDAATAALVSSASPIARSPFLHATASAGHL